MTMIQQSGQDGGRVGPEEEEEEARPRDILL